MINFDKMMDGEVFAFKGLLSRFIEDPVEPAWLMVSTTEWKSPLGVNYGGSTAFQALVEQGHAVEGSSTPQARSFRLNPETASRVNIASLLDRYKQALATRQASETQVVPTKREAHVAAPKTPRADKGPSVASVFRDTILANATLDDVAIFALVREILTDLPDSRLAYVKYYRKELQTKKLLPA